MRTDESCGWLVEAVGTVLHLRGGSNPAAMHSGVTHPPPLLTSQLNVAAAQLSNLCSNYSSTLVQLCAYMHESMVAALTALLAPELSVCRTNLHELGYLTSIPSK